jgi:hypothetical protein
VRPGHRQGGRVERRTTLFAAALSEAGKTTEAVQTGRHAVQLHRRLQRDRGAHEPSLAESLHILASCLKETAGWSTEVSSLLVEAVEIYRRLAGHQPEEYTFRLADALVTSSEFVEAKEVVAEAARLAERQHLRQEIANLQAFVSRMVE